MCFRYFGNPNTSRPYLDAVRQFARFCTELGQRGQRSRCECVLQLG